MRQPDPIPGEYRHVGLSGPISAATQELEARNVRAFLDAAEALRDEGHPAFPRWERVFTPLELHGTVEAALESRGMLARGEDHTTGPLYRALLRECYKRILHLDVLMVLPGWRASGGAVREAYLAHSVGIPVWAYSLDPSERWEMTLHYDLRAPAVGRWA